MKKYLDTQTIDYDKLDKTKTYIFEFTAPLMHVTFYKEPQLTLIGVRSNETGIEDDITTFDTNHNGFPIRWKVKSKDWLNISTFNNSKILMAGLRTKLFDDEKSSKDSSDYNEVIHYIPSIKVHVDKISAKIICGINTLIDKIKEAKQKEKKERFKFMNEHEFGVVGMKFIEKKYTSNEIMIELFNNQKTKKNN
jgi:hypothetical protein